MRGRKPKKKARQSRRLSLIERERAIHVTVRQTPGPRRTKRSLEVDLLRRVFERTLNLVRPMPKEIAPFRDQESLVLGLISRRVETRSDDGDSPNVEQLTTNRGLTIGLKYKLEVIDEVRKGYLEDLRAAIRAKANLVCFGECAYPFDHEHSENARQKNKEFQDRVQAIVNESAVHLVAGSFHDEDGHNVCYFFSPNKPVQMQRKVLAATRMGEKLPPPDDDSHAIFHAGDFFVGVLICLDAFAPTTVLRYALFAAGHGEQNPTGLPLKYIFVPSLNDTGSFKIAEACQDLSALCNCVVVYVNCNWQRPRRKVYCAGEMISNHTTIEASSEGTERPVRATFRHPSETSDLLTVKLPSALIEATRRRNHLMKSRVVGPALKMEIYRSRM